MQELEEQRRLSREAAKEKLVAVARAKDQVREQSIAELQDARDKVRQVRITLLLLFATKADTSE